MPVRTPIQYVKPGIGHGRYGGGKNCSHITDQKTCQIHACDRTSKLRTGCWGRRTDVVMCIAITQEKEKVRRGRRGEEKRYEWDGMIGGRAGPNFSANGSLESDANHRFSRLSSLGGTADVPHGALCPARHPSPLPVPLHQREVCPDATQATMTS